MIFEKEQNKALKILSSGEEKVKRYGSKIDLDEYQKAQEIIAKNQTVLVVCGECSVGKSSFLTEYIKEEGFFPIDADVATNAITLMSYAEKEKITVTIQEKIGKTKEIEITRDEIKNYVTEQGNRKNLKKVRMINIETPNEVLKKGLVLVDTPGVGGLEEDHSTVTAAFIPSADAVIYASEVTKPLDIYELEFIKQNIVTHTDNVIFVITKSDRVRSEAKEKRILTNKEKIADYLDLEEENIKIVPISSLAMKKYREKQNERFLYASNFQELDNQIIQTYTNRKISKMIIPNMLTAKGILTNIHNIQVEKYKTLINNKDEAKQLMLEHEALNKEKKELLKSNQVWRKTLSRGIKRLTVDLNRFTTMSFSEMSRQVNKDTNINMIITDSEHGKKYLKDLERRLINLAGEIQENCNMGIKSIMMEVEVQINDTLNKAEIKTDNINELQSGEFSDAKMVNKLEKNINIVKAASMGGSIGAGIAYAGCQALITAGVVTALWPVAIAIAAGGGLVAFFGGKSQRDNAKQKNNQVVQSAAREMIQETQMKVKDFITGVMFEADDACTTQVEDSINSQIAKNEDMITEVKEKIELDREQKKKAIEEIKQSIDELKEIINNASLLIAQYKDLSDKIKQENEKKLNTYKKKMAYIESQEAKQMKSNNTAEGEILRESVINLSDKKENSESIDVTELI